MSLVHRLKQRGVTSPAILAAFGSVDRGQFVPTDQLARAQDDTPLAIGYGQTISQPFVIAHMFQLLKLQSHHRVLDIGTGSGYQAALLAEIVDQVYSIEIVEALYLRARQTLESLGYERVRLRLRDGADGWPEQAPFDRIVSAAAPERIPDGLTWQLADGGIMVVPVGPSGGNQRLLCLRREGSRLIQREDIPVRFVAMTGSIEENPS